MRTRYGHRCVDWSGVRYRKQRHPFVRLFTWLHSVQGSVRRQLHPQAATLDLPTSEAVQIRANYIAGVETAVLSS